MNSHCNYRIKLAQGFLQELQAENPLPRLPADKLTRLAKEAVALAQTIARQLTEGGE